MRRLAKGGMAELYLARARGMHGFEKLVVLKLVLPHLAEDRQFVEMFLHEARLAGTLDHANIVQVIDIGEVDGEPFFVMEYIHGQDMAAILRAAQRVDSKIPLGCALTICAAVATGLHYVHERRDSDGRFLGLVHRDVSPSNVVVSYDGGVKLVDFGIAKATELAQATRAGVLKGKVHYMSPEQCDGGAIDRRADVFSLGILLYESTTGQRLFTGDNDFHVMSRIVRGVYARPSEVTSDYPFELEDIVMRALAADPEQRYGSAQNLLEDVQAFARQQRLAFSTLDVQRYLEELFGNQPLPNVADLDDVAPTALHPDSIQLPAQRRTGSSTAGLLEVTDVHPMGSPELPHAGPEPTAVHPVEPGVPSPLPAGSSMSPTTVRNRLPSSEPTQLGSPPVAMVGSTTVIAPAPSRPPTQVPIHIPVSDSLEAVRPVGTRPWLWSAVVLSAALGIAAVLALGWQQLEPSRSPTHEPDPEPIDVAAEPVEPSPEPTDAPSGVAPPQPETADGEAAAELAPESETVEVAMDEPTSEPQPETTERRRPAKKRGGRRKSRSKSGSKKSPGLDAMYPGG